MRTARRAAVVTIVALAAAASGAARAERLVVVSSGDSPAYRQALAGIRKAGAPVDTLTVRPGGDAAATAALARVGRDAAVVALDANASAVVARAATGLPVVHCMADAGDDARVPAATADVAAEVPIDVHLQWLHRLLPGARRVGILYDPAHNARRVDDAAAALVHAGYTPVLVPVPGPSALPGALARLANAVDVVLALPDATVFAREHTRALLLFSFRNGVPLTGPTEAWVRAGALYAVEWDYADVGRHCAALALRQLAGGHSPPPAPPRARVVVNLRTAGQQNVYWGADVLRAVDRVPE